MNADLISIVRGRLKSDGVAAKAWASLVLAACRGQDGLENLLSTGDLSQTPPPVTEAKAPAGTYLRSLTVQGFRGIGPTQTIDFSPGPGLTVVVGRNGSGKSSFAEALEVLFTGDSKRWSDRSKVWKDGWRNLHQPHPTTIDAVVLLEGEGPAKVACGWDEDASLADRVSFVQPRGRTKTSIDALGWKNALVSYRPFLSYNELGSMLDEGPSKLYDALSIVLGLEDLVTAQDALGKARLARQKALDAADETREELIARLTLYLDEESDDRATTCRDALTTRTWGLDVIAGAVSAAAVPAADQAMSILQRALSLDAGDPARVAGIATALREAAARLDAIAGSDAESSRKVIGILQAAIDFHTAHGDADCPVCGAASALTGTWEEAARAEIGRQRALAAGSDAAHGAADQARRAAREMLTSPPALLKSLFDISQRGVPGLDTARETWAAWHQGASLTALADLAQHLETRHDALADAVELLKSSVAEEIRRREDRWRPCVDALRDWLPVARAARDRAAVIAEIKEAEAWLKDAAEEVRNTRFAPIAERAMATWQHLRKHSNVTLGNIQLSGARSSRKVTLDVTVDGVRGAALGVMSQGELHSLALSLFLPRATLAESPFRFVVIDDPVQSMDPARVDGLARALEETARTRQVIVFTHDDRLPEAIRRMGITSTILSVTRRERSVVDVRTALDPVQANIEDALALAHTADLPLPVIRRVAPGFCRAALEAAFMRVIRRRRLAAGVTHAAVEEELAASAKLTPLAALALFNDREKGADVLPRLNKIGPWAGDVFRQCRDGAHQEIAGDLMQTIRDAEKLTARILELK
jgi:energy-coupling factor transporter ATP-binding protein EcfA2